EKGNAHLRFRRLDEAPDQSHRDEIRSVGLADFQLVPLESDIEVPASIRRATDTVGGAESVAMKWDRGGNRGVTTATSVEVDIGRRQIHQCGEHVALCLSVILAGRCSSQTQVRELTGPGRHWAVATDEPETEGAALREDAGRMRELPRIDVEIRLTKDETRVAACVRIRVEECMMRHFLAR